MRVVGSSGINFQWPDTNNPEFRFALAVANDGGSPNNICPVFTYSLDGGAKFVWMGDLEDDFMEEIESQVAWPTADVLFAPHHGRSSGKTAASSERRLPSASL
jgi:beta-lactamase superfamily II metal-dependent hydrolase